MYEMIDDSLTKNGVVVPTDLNNLEFQQFVSWVRVHGLSEVVKEREVTQENYKTARKRAYPNSYELIEMLFLDEKDGTTVFKDTIQAIHDLYPTTQRRVTKNRQLPKDFKKFVNQAVAKEIRSEYFFARKRLEEYILSEGLPEIVEEVEIDGETVSVVSREAVPALPAEHPAAKKDAEERAAAQAVVDGADQETKDNYEAKVAARRSKEAAVLRARQREEKERIRLLKKAQKALRKRNNESRN